MRTVLAAIILALLAIPLTARARADEHPVKAELLADVASIEPGQPFHVGVRLTLQPGWHVYWLNPGDSGQPPEVKWKLPDGFTVSDLRFPTPKHFDQPGEMVGYGYEDQVLLIATVTPPRDLKPGTSVTLEAQVWWLVCEDVCIPGEAKLSLPLSVADSRTPANAETFDRWLARLPREPAASGVRVNTRENVESGTLEILLEWPGAAPANVEWFPPPSDVLSFNDINVTNDGTATRITYKAVPLAGKAPPPVPLTSLVAYDAGDDDRRGVVVTIEFPRKSKEQ